MFMIAGKEPKEDEVKKVRVTKIGNINVNLTTNTNTDASRSRTPTPDIISAAEARKKMIKLKEQS